MNSSPCSLAPTHILSFTSTTQEQEVGPPESMFGPASKLVALVILAAGPKGLEENIPLPK